MFKQDSNNFSVFQLQPLKEDNRYDSAKRDFTPGYIKSMTGGKPPHGGCGSRNSLSGRSRGGGPPGRDGARKVINIPLQQDVKLHQTDNAWKPTHKDDKKQDPEQQKTDALYKAVTGILNKLTPQKFQTLVGQVLTLPIDTEERLKGCIDLVFEKAIDEPSFSETYAKLCKSMTGVSTNI